MRRSQPSPEHADAVSRRLATLSAELASVRGEEFTHTRIRPDVVATPTSRPEVGAEIHPEPVLIPTPGRHASRRPAGRMPHGPPSGVAGGLAGRVGLTGLGPAHVAVVAVVAALAVGFAAWLVVRDHAEPVAMPAVKTVESPLVQTPEAVEQLGGDDGLVTAEAGAMGSTTGVTVDVAGDVRRPGIAVLPAGSRVVDALEEAGGAKHGVDLTSLNLARLLVDGEQILVGVTPPTGVAGSVGAPGTPPAAEPLVNLNTADQVTLEGLPGVGPVTATSILDWRAEHGGFSAVEELLEVDGIGDATLADLAPLVTI